jgi:hypothetical protein
MKDTKIEQLLWLFLGALFTAAMIFFVKDGMVVTSLSMTYTGIVGIFLGVDIAVMIKKTSALPAGEFKPINKQRYITSLIIFALLLAEAFLISGLYNRDCDSLYASFGMGFLIVVGGLMGAVEGNKLVTGSCDAATSPAVNNEAEK